MSEALGTILLVEDEPSDAAMLRRGFEKAEVLNPVVHLANGDDALAYLEGLGPYIDRVKYPLPVLILLDLKLPGLSGIQLLEWMRTRPEIRRIPVVVLTADSERGTVNAAYELGANSYLVKPADPANIVRIVEAIQQYWIQLNEPPYLVRRAQPW
jgi:CheY-like chemotaxis protein